MDALDREVLAIKEGENAAFARMLGEMPEFEDDLIFLRPIIQRAFFLGVRWARTYDDDDTKSR